MEHGAPSQVQQKVNVTPKGEFLKHSPAAWLSISWIYIQAAISFRLNRILLIKTSDIVIEFNVL